MGSKMNLYYEPGFNLAVIYHPIYIAQHLVENYIILISRHYCNCRLEIAVNDVRETSAVCHRKTFFDKL
jgi:hypothetical protein